MGLMVETVHMLGWVPPRPTHHAPGTQCVITGACLRSYELLLLLGLRLCVSWALGRCFRGDMVSIGGTEG